MDFIYTARNVNGEIVSDTISAPSREVAGRMLRDQGLLPTSIKGSGKRSGFNKNQSVSALIKHVSLLEKLTFIKNLAVTIRSGLPISNALKVVTVQMPNVYFQGIIREIAHGVESGKTLSESMAGYPKVFTPMFVNMVKVGEESGQLENSLDYLGKQVSRDYNLIRRTKGALMYPSVVIIALLILGYIMFTFVLPKLTATFEEFNTDLPALTKVIIRGVDVFSNYSLLIALVVIALVGTFWYWRKTERGRQVVHKLILRLPVIGKIVKKINLARFTIIFSSLLKSGMQIVEALKVTGETMGNVYYRAALLEASDKVKVGVDLTTILEKEGQLFPPMVTQMVQVGTESGTMEQVLEEVANFYETEVDDSVKNLSSIIEPVLVILIGGVVGVLAVGLILPIYNLGTAI